MSLANVEIWSDFPIGPVLTFVGAVVSALLGYQAKRFQSKKEHAATVPAGWRDLTTEMKSWFEDRTKELEDRLAKMEDKERIREGYEMYVSDAIHQQRVWGNENQVLLPVILTFPEWRREQDQVVEPVDDPDAVENGGR